jgi:hypothetical protein
MQCADSLINSAMIMELYPKVEKFVEESFSKIGIDDPNNLEHLKNTVILIKQLKPNADEALLIAAISHDIERAYRDKGQMEKMKHGSKEYYQVHQEKGAEIIGKFLESTGAPKSLINKVKHLVSKHEIGGGEEADLLKDADSMDFFVNKGKLDWYINVRIKKIGKDNTKIKLDRMFERISSDKAKEIARPMYLKAINDLETYGGK